MSKYSPLFHYLKKLSAQGRDRWQASFAEIEEVLGFSLPKSAHTFPAWWSNEISITTHVQTRMWQEAGWKTENVNLAGKKIVFYKVAA